MSNDYHEALVAGQAYLRAEIRELRADNERLRDLAADLMDLVNEMPIKHPHQGTRRNILWGQCQMFGVRALEPKP